MAPHLTRAPNDQPPVAQRVRAFAIQALHETERLLAFADLARRFGYRAVTLRRRLAREGSTYRNIRNSCRCELALDRLCRAALTIEDIAAQLDFCDPNASGAWMSDTPTGYRHRMQLRAPRG